jgi:threonine dehydrogenase-like Zn-dependent dehydrogenase
MRALTFEGTGEIGYSRVADPTIVDPHDAIVRVTVAGLCGSDLHVYRGRESGLDLGTVMGHELLGEVVAVGSAVRACRPGARVVSPFSTSCGDCFYCLHGLPARCQRGALLGWVSEGRGLAGAQAELVRIPLADSTLVAVPAELPAVEALLAGDVLATGWFAAENGGVGRGSTVAVIGCGAVGLMAVAASSALGAARVLACDGVEGRRTLAATFGGESVDLGAVNAAVTAATEGRGVDVVIEAVGSPEATRLAYDLVRLGGTISAVGVHTEPTLAVSPGALYDKNLTYRAGRCPARALLPRLLEVAASRRIPLAALISHRLSLAEGPAAYAAFERREPGWTKVVFEM